MDRRLSVSGSPDASGWGEETVRIGRLGDEGVIVMVIRRVG